MFMCSLYRHYRLMTIRLIQTSSFYLSHEDICTKTSPPKRTAVTTKTLRQALPLITRRIIKEVAATSAVTKVIEIKVKWPSRRMANLNLSYCFLHGPLAKYVKLLIVDCPHMRRECRGCLPRHRGLAIPTCTTARVSRSCRETCRNR